MRLLLLLAAAGLLAACAEPTHIKAYAGPDLPADQVALVKPLLGVHVLAIDGDRAYSVRTTQMVGYRDVQIALPAGNHKIEVALNTGSTVSTASVTLDLQARPGHKYLILYDTRAAYSFQPRIEDRTDRPHTWCTMPGAAASEKGC